MIITSSTGTKPNSKYIPNNPSAAEFPVMRIMEVINPAIIAMIPAIKKSVQF
jgi:hypothetical protein